MKSRHIQIRIEQALALSQASHCPRLKVAAILLDPERNAILADGYNGGPRGAGGDLCMGYWCERNGFQKELARIEPGSRMDQRTGQRVREIQVHYGDTERVQAFTVDSIDIRGEDQAAKKAQDWVEKMVKENPPIESGTRIEQGCHHAEMNVICNAAAQGTPTKGAWMIVLAEPCLMCAKLIHHAGIERVIVIEGGYLGGKTGVKYLRDNGVKVQEVPGPKDPRRGE